MNHIESLLGDFFGHILDHLNNNTGSKELVNHADIPVVIRYANRLTSTSKTMAAKINHAGTFQLFLTSLQQRFGQSYVHFASMMNTSGTRKWMWNHIQAKGDARTYQVETIHAVFEALLGVLKNNKNAALWTEFLPETRIAQRCVWDLYQDNTSVVTPFGKISYRFVNSENNPVSISPDDEKKLRAKAIEIDKKNLRPLNDFTPKNHNEHDWFIWETLKTEKLGLDPTPMEPKPKEPTSSFDHISKLTGWATKLVDRLQIRPLQRYTDKGSKSLRQLKLEKNSVDTLCALSFAAKSFLHDPNSWVLCAFDNDPEAIYLERPTVSGFHDQSNHYIGHLKDSFNSVIQYIGLNWKQAELKNYPSLVNIKSEEDYVLLIKTKNLLPEEGNLINCVAVQLGLSTSLLSGGDGEDLNYLWVKKEGLQDTLKALNINL